MAPLWPPFLKENVKDLRIICSDGETSCSSLLLAVASPFICQMLKTTEEDENQLLILPDTKLVIVKALTDLVHSGYVNICCGEETKAVKDLAILLKFPVLAQHATENKIFGLECCERKEQHTNDISGERAAASDKHSDPKLNPYNSRTFPHENIVRGIITQTKMDSIQPVAKRKWVKKIKCHPCPYCEKAFFSRAQQQDHVKKHEGRPSYCCDTCGKGFFRKDCLTNHTKTVHNCERNYACETCGKKFGTKYKLERHLKIHRVLLVGRRVQRRQVAPVSLLKTDLIASCK